LLSSPSSICAVPLTSRSDVGERTNVTPASSSVVSSVSMKLFGPRPTLSWLKLAATRGVTSLSSRSIVRASPPPREM
jgi:hypothetical protein